MKNPLEEIAVLQGYATTYRTLVESTNSQYSPEDEEKKTLSAVRNQILIAMLRILEGKGNDTRQVPPPP